MDKTDFLVIESNPARADSVISALQFLGFSPQHAGGIDQASSDRALRGIYIGDIDDAAVTGRQLDSLGEAVAHLPLLLAEDSPWAARLLAASSPFYGRVGVIGFPLRYEQFAEAMRCATARSSGARRGEQRFVGESRAMGRVNALIRQVAPFDSSVLVLGESGTGKEMVARTIHDCSPRKDKPFVAINCGAIPAELLESGLFGHEKGAFTGAIKQTLGKIEVAGEEVRLGAPFIFNKENIDRFNF